MNLTWPPKDPQELLDYDVDWTDRLNGDTITDSVWSIAKGTVTISDQSATTTDTKVWLAGGTLGETCEVLNHITTAALREMEQTVRLKIRAK